MKPKLDIKIRQGDLELQSAGKHLNLDCEHTTAYIVKWYIFNGKGAHSGREFNYVLAYWVRGKEGYDLHFVGNRPLEDSISYATFHFLAKYGQKQLDQYFEETKYT